jgi:anaerobic selenocysteine-containing dehydrogenase
VALRDGAIRHVRGDVNHPVSRGRLCAKCTSAYNGVFIDPQARLTRPLLRDGPKGSGAWRAASWDEALATIAARLQTIADDPAAGAGTILNAHYTGTFALLGYAFPLRFMRTLGAREVDPDTICNKAGHVALDYLFGTSEDGFDPRTSEQAKAILVWGANPSASAPHQHSQWLPESPGRVIVVDPVRTDTARQADLHLQPYPGSDAALAYAIAHVIWRDGLGDPKVRKHRCVGWDEVEQLLADCTPEWGEGVTGVPAEQIKQAAQWYGPGPSLLWIGQGFQRQPRGGNAVRAVGQLAAISGNLGRSGAGVLYLNGTDSRRLDYDYVATGGLPDNSPAPISHMDLLSWLQDPVRTKALVCWNINIAASNPEQRRLREALQREDLFTVAVDLFATDTTDLADVVLPAASFLECDDIVASYFNLSLSAQVAATAPLGESLPNSEIFRRLAAAMGMTEPALFESDADVIERLLVGTRTGLTFAELARRGTVWSGWEPRVQFADLEFPTPSGRVELASARAQADGHPRVAQPWFDQRPSGQRLRLLTPASRWSLNDSFVNEPKLAGRLGLASVALHPLDAAERGLADGEPALLSSETGELQLTVVISGDVPRGVALSPKGRWPRMEPQHANVNVLNPGIPSDMGASSTVHGLEVTVTSVPAAAAAARPTGPAVAPVTPA